MDFNQPQVTQSDNGGALHEVYTNTATPVLLAYLYTPVNGEKGTLDLNYAGSDANGLGRVIRQVIPYSKNAAGVVTINSKLPGLGQVDSGYSTLDCNVVTSGGNIQVNVVGIANKPILHAVQLMRNSAVFNKPA